MNLLSNPWNIPRHVRINTGQLWVRAHYTPGHYSADEPPVAVVRISAQQWATRVALIKLISLKTSRVEVQRNMVN